MLMLTRCLSLQLVHRASLRLGLDLGVAGSVQPTATHGSQAQRTARVSPISIELTLTHHTPPAHVRTTFFLPCSLFFFLFFFLSVFCLGQTPKTLNLDISRNVPG